MILSTKIIKKFTVPILVLVIWQAIFYMRGNAYVIVPPPFIIINTFYKEIISGEFLPHVFASLKRVFVGFSLACFVSIPLGLVFGYYKKIGDYFLPIINTLKPIPPIAWIPIAILIFGLDDGSSYAIIFLGAFFPIFTSVFYGVRSFPKVLKNVSSTFEIEGFEFFKKILFYFSLGHILTGMSIGIGMAWMSVIASELIGAQSGLGYYIQLNRLLLRTDKIVVGMISIGVIGLLLDILFKKSRKLLMPWND